MKTWTGVLATASLCPGFRQLSDHPVAGIWSIESKCRTAAGQIAIFGLDSQPGGILCFRFPATSRRYGPVE